MAKRPGTDGSPGMERAGRLRGFKVARMLQVAADSGADPAMLLRLCRALAAFSVLTVDGAGSVGQSPLSATLRGDARPTLLHAARYWRAPSA